VAVSLDGIDLSGSNSFIGSTRKTSSYETASGPRQGTSQSDNAVSQGDAVDITTTASLLAHLERSLTAQPAVDTQKVDAIRKAVESGTYTVDPAKVAAGLTHSERTLAQLPLAEI
jgi:negative regulator of flagellin synthesis FlgM